MKLLVLVASMLALSCASTMSVQPENFCYTAGPHGIKEKQQFCYTSLDKCLWAEGKARERPHEIRIYDRCELKK